jgi:hypothetical protein
MRAVGKRREVGRELFRKHRKDFGGGINRGGVGRRVAIDSRAFFTIASTSATATKIFTTPPGSCSATES